jgi:hypothetical protein
LKNHFIKASIRYTVKAKLVSRDGETLMTHARDIVVRNKHGRLSMMRPTLEDTMAVSNCCFPKGQVTMHLAMTSQEIPAVGD